MADWILLLLASGGAVALLWPPRRDEGRWLGAALALLWAAIVAVGVRRGLADGMGPWLIVLALIGALAALLVLWSLVSAMTQRG